MKLKTQLTKKEQLIGKMISEVHSLNEWSNDLDVIVFTDNTFVAFQEDHHNIQIMKGLDILSYKLVRCGIASEEEYKQLMDEQEQIRIQKQEAWERKQYEQLKKKYGDKTGD